MRSPHDQVPPAAALARVSRVRVLVLGASGMLGHKVVEVFAERFETSATVRDDATPMRKLAPANASIIEGITAEPFAPVEQTIADVRPDAVVNCIGIVKQLDAAKDPIPSITVNSLFPHRLADVCAHRGTRLLHISTDCVFSGRAGSYTETDIPDPVDLYGRSKLLGEIDHGALTVRTSIVGRELHGAHGLVEWFLGQNGQTVRGYRRAVFSGWSTRALSNTLAEVLERHPDLTGLWHVAAQPIAKFDLLQLLRDAFDLDVEVEPDVDFVCDRSLDGSRFEEATGIVAPSWETMVRELREESPAYDRVREAFVAQR
jgi:dTDP-4-dehydrorhamnose reductase